MKAAGIVILLAVLSVLIVSRYVAGGTLRIAALVMLGASAIGAVVGLLQKRSSRCER
jgi:hypothetical protein